MKQNLIQEAVNILQENIYATLGTVGKDLTPWVSPLFVSWDADFNIYWISPKNCWHSDNIRNNNRVSLVWFNSQSPKWTGKGVYLLAQANELEDMEEIRKGVELEYKKLGEKMPPIDQFEGESYRVYAAKPIKIWITDDKIVDGHTIDSRTEINLTDLTKALKLK